MNRNLARFWWLSALLSIVCLGLCPQIGWYALANLIICLAGVYMLHQADSRRKRIEGNQELFRKMTRRQKRAFQALDDREFSNLNSLTRLMPYLCFGCLMLDGYTYYYNLTTQHSAAVFDTSRLQSASAWLMVIGLAFGVIYYFAWREQLSLAMIPLNLTARVKKEI